MTIPANTQAEASPWGSIPVTPCFGAQGGPYTPVGNGNGLPVQGAVAAGSTATNPVLTGGVDGSGNAQAMPCNQDLTLLASAARTATTASSTQHNYGGVGLFVTLQISVASGTGGLTLHIQYWDVASSSWIDLLVDGSALTTTGTFFFTVVPVSGGPGRGTKAAMLPTTWRVNVVPGDSSSYTYSVGASVIL